jgi:hypothetical protein
LPEKFDKPGGAKEPEEADVYEVLLQGAEKITLKDKKLMVHYLVKGWASLAQRSQPELSTTIRTLKAWNRRVALQGPNSCPVEAIKIYLFKLCLSRLRIYCPYISVYR